MTANAATIINGSFETGTAPGKFTLLAPGSSAIDGWTIVSGSVDYVGSYWNASDGARSVDLSGKVAGAISQVLATVAGQTYTVSFDVAGNPDGRPLEKTLSVGATGAASETKSFTVVPGVNTKANMGWQTYSYTFTAGGPSTTLSFASLTNTGFGPALDNVVISALSGVPEPAVWGMLLVGFGGIGMALRRHRREMEALA